MLPDCKSEGAEIWKSRESINQEGYNRKNNQRSGNHEHQIHKGNCKCSDDGFTQVLTIESFDRKYQVNACTKNQQPVNPVWDRVNEI